jgi:hypothetical protein
MDSTQPSRCVRRSENFKDSVSMENDESLHEASWHHHRLHEKTVFGPHGSSLSRDSSQQKIRPCKYNTHFLIVIFLNHWAL